MRLWSRWEGQAKDGTSTDLGQAAIMHHLGTSPLSHGLRMAFRASWLTVVDQRAYTLLRLVFRTRVDLATSRHSQARWQGGERAGGRRARVPSVCQ